MSIREPSVSVAPNHTQTTSHRTKRRPAARLGAGGLNPVPQTVLEKAARNRQALSFQSRALLRLIDDLLKGETRSVEVEAALFPDLRLPGDNPDDVLRYLLRGLCDEIRNFDQCLATIDVDPSAVALRLGQLRRLAEAVAQAFGAAPATGAGHAIVSMIGDLLDRSGLVPWPQFLALQGAVPADAPADAAARRETPAAPPTPEAGPEPGRQSKPAPVSANAETPASAAPPRGPAGAAVAPAAKAPEVKEPADADADDPLEIPLMLVRPLQGDWTRVLFKRGLGYLTKVYGETPEELRPLLGTWLAQSGDDHQKVFRLLAKAQTQKEPDPKGWVSKILMENQGAHSAA